MARIIKTTGKVIPEYKDMADFHKRAIAKYFKHTSLDELRRIIVHSFGKEVQLFVLKHSGKLETFLKKDQA